MYTQAKFILFERAYYIVNFKILQSLWTIPI